MKFSGNIEYSTRSKQLDSGGDLGHHLNGGFLFDFFITTLNNIRCVWPWQRGMHPLTALVLFLLLF